MYVSVPSHINRQQYAMYYEMMMTEWYDDKML